MDRNIGIYFPLEVCDELPVDFGVISRFHGDRSGRSQFISRRMLHMCAAEHSVRVQRGCCNNEADAVLFAPHLLSNFGNEILLLSSSCTQEACN
jgi:hypothetical protein